MGDCAADPPMLIGVGVGPGDPELVTMKAVRVLSRADVILVPRADTSADDVGRAERIVLAAVAGAADKLTRIPFSMAQRRGVGAIRRDSWTQSANEVIRAFREGARVVAFVTVGDPSVYSTFSYLAAEVLARVPEASIEVVPGITAMQAVAAASRTPLVEGSESLTLMPATAGLEAIGEALASSDTVVTYKCGRWLRGVRDLAAASGRRGVLAVDIGLSGQRLIALDEVDEDAGPYFSTALIAPHRSQTGGRL